MELSGRGARSIGKFRAYQYIEAYDMLQIIGTTADTVFVDSLLIGNIMCGRIPHRSVRRGYAGGAVSVAPPFFCWHGRCSMGVGFFS